MVVLVTGASGQLGQSLQEIANQYPQMEFVFADSTMADLTDSQKINALFNQIQPKYCINAAAYTAVDKAESEPEKAFAVNASGVQNLAIACNNNNCTLLHISTDFVFDGLSKIPYKETDSTNPQGVYAQSKLQGEQAVANALEAYFIVRTSWVYSSYGNNFMKTMLRLGAERSEISVVDDQIGTPTLATDLADALLQIIASGKKEYGIYHFSNGGQTSWCEFAREIFEVNAVNVVVNPIPTSAYPTPAKRPAYSVLDKSKISQTFGIAIKDWKQSLKNA